MATAVNTKQELIDVIVHHTKDIQAYGVRQLGIFGSFVKGQVTEKSDVDFYIDFKPEFKTLHNFVGLANYFQSILGRKVEIVTPQSLNKFTGKYIIQEVEYVSLAA